MTQPGSAISASATPNVAITIALCFFVAVLEGFDIQAIGVAAPRLAPEFGLTPSQLGWVFAISNIGLVIGASMGGWLADRVGRKPVFIGSVLTFGVFTLLTSFAASFPALFFVRFFAGLGFGAALPNMMAVAAEISTPEKRASTASTMFCGMPLGGGTSALLTQLLPPDFDWRVLFIVGGVLPLLLAPALYLLMPETLEARERQSAARPNVVRALFGEGRASATLLLWFAFFPTLLILYLILNWLPSLVVANGLDRAAAPQASLAFNFASVVGALVVGRMVDRVGARWPLVICYVVLIGALVALGGARGVAMILVLSGMAGFFLMGANYALYGVAASYYPQQVRGVGSGASVAVGRVGSIVGPVLAGLLLGAGATATNVMQLMAPAAAIAAIAVFALSFRPKPEH
jgi:AAHS family 3-hydroxyphenylpropionic acid transporter